VGCRFTPSSCSRARHNLTLPSCYDARRRAPERGRETATVGLEAFGRDINDYFCHDRFADDWVSGDDQWINVTVPWSELTGTTPFTLHWSHTVSDPYRSVTRIASVTLKPVGPDGGPAG
jgi:hypothetical protein